MVMLRFNCKIVVIKSMNRTNYIFISILSFLLFFLLGACSSIRLTERRYSSGYHLDIIHKHKNTADIQKQDKINSIHNLPSIVEKKIDDPLQKGLTKIVEPSRNKKDFSDDKSRISKYLDNYLRGSITLKNNKKSNDTIVQKDSQRPALVKKTISPSYKYKLQQESKIIAGINLLIPLAIVLVSLLASSNPIFLSVLFTAILLFNIYELVVYFRNKIIMRKYNLDDDLKEQLWLTNKFILRNTIINLLLWVLMLVFVVSAVVSIGQTATPGADATIIISIISILTLLIIKLILKVKNAIAQMQFDPIPAGDPTKKEQDYNQTPKNRERMNDRFK